jgi:hypothetical protein
VEKGSHAELIDQDGAYKRLYVLQFEDADAGQPGIAAAGE